MEVCGKNSHLAMAIPWETVRIRWEIWLPAKPSGRVGRREGTSCFRNRSPRSPLLLLIREAMNWPFLTDCKTDQSYPLLFTFSNPPDALVTLHSTLLVGSDKWWEKGCDGGWEKKKRTNSLLQHDQVLSAIWLQHNLIVCKTAFFSPHILTLGSLRSTRFKTIKVVDKECCST